MNTEIRRATADDAPAISEVLRESFLEYRPQYTDEAFAATALSAEGVLRRMAEGPVWVGLTGERITSTVSAFIEGGELWARGMAVLPGTRSQGIGWRLLEQIESYARAACCQRMVLSTTPFLHHAISLYERYGFRHSPAGPHEMFGTPLFTMVKSVGSNVNESSGLSR
jgi:GNAT superfamily N-acetyltransferase